MSKTSSGMFQKGKEMISDLFSTKSNPVSARPSNHGTHPDIIADFLHNPGPSANDGTTAFEREQASLTPVLGRKNKFWLSGGPPSQQTRTRSERNRLHRLSPKPSERRMVTAETQRQLLKLEDENIDVRDFQYEHDEAKKKERQMEADVDSDLDAIEESGHDSPVPDKQK